MKGSIKWRNILATGVIICQCGCGHTYFAWSKPLPVEQTESDAFLAAGMFASPFPNSSSASDTRANRRAMQSELDQAVRSHFNLPKR
jgi:hypothetical protein